MKQTGSLRILLLAAVATIAAAWFVASGSKPSWEQEAARRKASYVYLDALDVLSAQDLTLYYQLLNKAHALDPKDLEVRHSLGLFLKAAFKNQQMIDSGFNMMVDAYINNEDESYINGIFILQQANNAQRYGDAMKIALALKRRFPKRSDVDLALAGCYIDKASFGDLSYVAPAKHILDSLEAQFGKSYEITHSKIATHMFTNDTIAIYDELSSLHQALPNDLYTTLNIAKAFAAFNRPDSAIAYLNHACELDSTNGTAMMMRAQLLQQLGDSTSFESEAFKAVRSQDLDLDTKLQFITSYVIMLYSDSTRYSNIENLFETMIDVNPGEAPVHLLYAQYFIETDRLDRAAEQMDYVVSLERSNPQHWIMLAQLYGASKKYDVGAARIDEASELFPDNEVIVNISTAMHLAAGDTIGAIKALEEFPDSTIADPIKRSDFLQLKAETFYRVNRTAEAFELFESAIKINPYNNMAMNNLAYFYAVSDTLIDRAAQYAQLVTKLEPDNPTYLDTYAWVLYRKGDYEKAREYIDRTLNLYEPDATITTEIYEHAGDIYYRCGLIDEAVDFWKKALEAEPENTYLNDKIKQRKIITNDP